VFEQCYNGHTVITHLGTFDVENYGDLLYPIVLCHLLKTRTASLQVRHYSLLPGEAPQDAGFETHSIQSLFESPLGQCTLLIGGGDILRTDSDVMAHHYRRSSRVSYEQLRRSIGTLDAFGYLLRKNIPRLNPAGFYADRFRVRWMNYTAAGPFLIDRDDLPHGSSVSYLSCGVPHEFTPLEKNRVERILDQAHFIYLRDQQSVEKLRRAGVQRELRVAPDLTITLSDQFDKKERASKGRDILSRLGVDVDRPLLCFQSQPHPGFDEEEIVRQLKCYQERNASSIVLLPTGYCHGDHKFLQSLARRSGGALKYAGVYSIFDMMDIIAASDLFIGTSLHGNITALSFGIPNLFGPLPVAKAEGFLNITKLPPELKLRSWREINDKIDMAVGLGRALFAERAREAKARVYQAVDELLENE